MRNACPAVCAAVCEERLIAPGLIAPAICSRYHMHEVTHYLDQVRTHYLDLCCVGTDVYEYVFVFVSLLCSALLCSALICSDLL